MNCTPYKQLERASNFWQTSDDKSKITEAFFKLDREAATPNKIRQDYDRGEKMELLRNGIKSDISALIRKNPDFENNYLFHKTTVILKKNLVKIGLKHVAEDVQSVNTLSREISEKIEAKQKVAIKSNMQLNLEKSDDVLNKTTSKIFGTETKTAATKNNQIKISPNYLR